jgi:hypothetical protein
LDASFEEILRFIRQHLETEVPMFQKLITSGRHFSNWLSSQIRFVDQIILNAFFCRKNESTICQRNVESEITGELSIFNPKPLSYQYEDFTLMKAVINNLIEEFCSAITVDDVIAPSEFPRYKSNEYYGFIVVTLVKIPTIVQYIPETPGK